MTNQAAQTTLPASVLNNTAFVEIVRLRASHKCSHANTWTVLSGITQSRDYVCCNHVNFLASGLSTSLAIKIVVRVHDCNPYTRDVPMYDYKVGVFKDEIG